MLIIAKLLFTSLLKRVYGAVAFAMAHWRVFLPILIATLTLLYIYGLKRDIASLNMTIYQYKAQIEKDTIIARQEEQAALSKVLVIEKSHKEQLSKLKLDRNRETNAIKAIYENKLNTLNRNVANRLPNQPATHLPISASDTQRLAEGGGECDANYSTLEKACQITTIDFNTCRAWADVVCETVECK
jgi:hypothetical protein